VKKNIKATTEELTGEVIFTFDEST